MPNTDNVCKNCKHWRDTAWNTKGWGVCENPLNEVKQFSKALVSKNVADLQVANEINNSIRYPEDFGCIFFEALDTTS